MVKLRQLTKDDSPPPHIDEAVGDGQGAFATEQALLQSRRAAVQPLYEAAYTAPGRMFAPFVRAGHGMTEETAQSVGERLLSTDPAAASALADMFLAAQQRAAQPTLAPVGIMAGFNSPRHGRERGERAAAGGR